MAQRRVEHITPAYRGVMYGSTPLAVWWGRLEVVGLELLPLTGPILLAGNHDSYWDTVTTGIAAMPRRQIRALAKATMWNQPVLAKVLDGMGQIPIDRDKGDHGALDRAVYELKENGICLGVYPEGTRSLGRTLRPRSGFGRLAERVPEAKILCAACSGTVDIPKFPQDRPKVRVEFFEPAGGPKRSDETAAEFSARILAEIRAKAPISVAGRARAKRIAAGDDPEVVARESGARPGG
ncbi:MAG: 1-acyl-sn-glycerol-3-phosphate acyltransferase [Solirubrobacterales bacterium]|nr:1-acyl-sn-glycerol-3-phosphate acyltransferase [Solirubrobacterales bacterium]